jgi:hypothetical protein
MITFHLKEFIKTGKFGVISIGSTKDELVNALGKKTYFLDAGESQIISYGSYEFCIWTETGKIIGIQNDHLQADCLNHADMINFKNRKWKLDKWFLENDKNKTFKDVIEKLKEEQIEFEITKAYKTSTENIIKCLESNVQIHFAKDFNTVVLDEKGTFKHWEENVKKNQEDFVLHAITVSDMQI